MLWATRGLTELSNNVSLVQLGANSMLSFVFWCIWEGFRGAFCLAILCCVRGVLLSFTSIFIWLWRAILVVVPISNKKIRVALGWEHNSLVGHVVSCKKLRYEGLYTFLGMIRYCMKDKEEDPFRFCIYVPHVQECASVPQSYLVILLRSIVMDVMSVVLI